jgi:predicted dehydrogenase
MSKSICRWGILGAASIARKNWQAIRLSGNGRLVAVASRNRDRAAAFIAECQSEAPVDPAPRAIGGYEELLAAEDIDAVYIPLPTGMRLDYVRKAAAAGKHVLCEKPCGVNAGEVAAMIEACAAAGVQFMDGVMFMHSDRLPALRKVIDDGKSIGKMQRLATQFSFMAGEEFHEQNIRVDPVLEPHGCLGDLGWYCLRMMLWTLHWEMPASLRARLIRASRTREGEAGVPLSLSAELVFASGPTANFYSSFEAENQQWFTISGSKGYIQVPDFVLPHSGTEVGFSLEQSHFQVEGCRFQMKRNHQDVRVSEYSDGHANAQETKLFRQFGELVLQGKPDPFWPDISLKTQILLDACLQSAQDGGREIFF